MNTPLEVKILVRLRLNGPAAERMHDALCKELLQLEAENRKLNDDLFTHWTRWEYLVGTLLLFALAVFFRPRTDVFLAPLACAFSALAWAGVWVLRARSKIRQRASALSARFDVFYNIVCMETVEEEESSDT